MKRAFKKIQPVFDFLAAFRRGFPSRKLFVVGIAGVSGKTITVDLTHRILEQTGKKVASISSVKIKIEDSEMVIGADSPKQSNFFLQKFLQMALKSGCKYAIIEVAPNADIYRFINFDIAVLTNSSQESSPAQSAQLFRQAHGLHIINMDDRNVGYFLQCEAKEKMGYSILENPTDDVSRIVAAKNTQDLLKSLHFEINNVSFNLNLTGFFNIYNALGAICVGLSQELSLQECKKALETVEGIPGRLENVYLGPFRAVVDYAFTPDTLKQTYEVLTRQLELPASKLICVLGARGEKDQWKRKILGQVAGQYCQEILITNEDPFDEDPQAIINQVALGAGDRAIKIIDRREAINKALSIANEGDIVAITGKGSEPLIHIGNKKIIPWDDRKVVKEEAKALGIALAPREEAKEVSEGKRALSHEMQRLQKYRDAHWR